MKTIFEQQDGRKWRRQKQGVPLGQTSMVYKREM